MHRKRFPLSIWEFPSLEEAFPLAEFSGETGVSVYDKGNNVVVEADMPGITDADDVEITLDKGVLWIRGEKKEKEEDREKKYYRRSSRSFSYRLSLPSNANLEKDPEATFEDGVMTIRFEKTAGNQAKKIQVKRK